VTEAPDASEIPTAVVDDRRGIAVESGSVDQLHFIEAGFFPMAVEILNFGQECFRVLDRSEGVFEDGPIFSVDKELGRDLENLDHSLILKDSISPCINHKNSVDGGVDLGFKKGRLGVQFDLGAFALRDIADHPVGEDEAVFLVSANGSVMKPDPRAVLALESKLDIERLTAAEEIFDRALKGAQVLWMGSAQEQL
jgi:hypothetical protein